MERPQLPKHTESRVPARSWKPEHPGPWLGPVESPSPPPAEQDDVQALMGYLLPLWRHKWVLLSTVVAGLLVALVVSLFTTPIYTAVTILEIQNFQEALTTSLTGSDPNIVTQTQLLASQTMRGRAAGVIRSNPVPPTPEVLEPLGWLRRLVGLSSPLESVEWDQALNQAVRTLSVAQTDDDSRLVSINSSSPNPQAAADFVNTIAREYIASAAEVRREVYEENGLWLTDAAEEQRIRVEESERALRDFAESAGLILTDGSANITEDHVRQVQAQMIEAAEEVARAEADYNASLSSPTAALPEVLDNGPMATYQVQITDLKRQLAFLKTTLTPGNFEVRQVQNQIDELERIRESERGNIVGRYKIELDSARQRYQALRDSLLEQSRILSGQQELLVDYNVLRREVEINTEIYQTMLARGKETNIVAAMRPTGARVVDAAWTPDVPVTPNLPFNLALGMMGGFGLGAGVVLLRSRVDTRIQVPGALSGYLHVRELGVIPSARVDPEVKELIRQPGRRPIAPADASPGRLLSGSNGNAVDPEESLELVSWTRKPSLFAESFRSAMTSILYSGENGDRPRVMLVTSPSPKEGKSTVVSNLAIALAEIGQRVLLIDGDLRRPRIHTIFDVPNTYGMSDILHERTPIDSYEEGAIVRRTRIRDLYVLPAGPARSSVTRLLYSDRARELVARFRDTFDIVLIDGAPVLAVGDSRVLGRVVDAVILVFRAHRTTEESAFAAAGCFAEDGTRILGTILNDWNPKASGYGYYGYYGAYASGYGQE